MNTTRTPLGILVALTFVLFAASHGGRAQEAMAGSMMEECRTMMSSHRQMKSDMEAAQAKLDALVAEMNAAEGDAKTAAMADVITELASQRKSTMSRMMDMEPRMMQHMMGHMRTGMKEGAERGMECPMMKEMGDKNPSSL